MLRSPGSGLLPPFSHRIVCLFAYLAMPQGKAKTWTKIFGAICESFANCAKSGLITFLPSPPDNSFTNVRLTWAFLLTLYG